MLACVAPCHGWLPSPLERRVCSDSECTQALWERCLNAKNCWAPCKQPAPDDVWATIVNGNSINYTSMALVQALSVRLFSCYQHVSLVTPEVNAETRGLLRGAGSEVREVPHIFWERQPAGVIEGYRWLFSKLNLWRPGAVGHARVSPTQQHGAARTPHRPQSPCILKVGHKRLYSEVGL
eukprot:170278-Prymnesium_polylepis.1